MSKKATAGTYLVRIALPVLVLGCISIFIWPYMMISSENSATYAAESAESSEVLGADRATDSDATEGSSDEVFAKVAELEADEAVTYVDGEYTGSGMGYNGPVTVSVTIEGGVITNVKPLSSDEDDPYYTWVIKEIPSAIVEKGSTDVDTVSGATTSSKALIAAVEDALSQATE